MRSISIYINNFLYYPETGTYYCRRKGTNITLSFLLFVNFMLKNFSSFICKFFNKTVHDIYLAKPFPVSLLSKENFLSYFFPVNDCSKYYSVCYPKRILHG